MSTNKTQNYQLHAWEPGDDFLLSEINANFAVIDALLAEIPRNKKLRIVTGSYTGNSSDPQTITLGFRPTAVLVVGRCSNYDNFVGLYLPGLSSGGGDITDTGFTASGMLNYSSKRSYNNIIGPELNPFRYIALYWED